MRVMIAGGGTGGHVFPGIAIFEALRRLHGDLAVLFVGARGGVEKKIFSDAGLPHVLLPGRGLRGASAAGRLKTMVLFAAALARAIKEIRAFKPDVVIGTGGYASAAAVIAAVACRRVRVVQEQNSVPGMVNRWLARAAHLVLLSYEESRPFIPSRVTCAVVGNPLRISPGGAGGRDAGLRFLGLRKDLPTVLIIGGSGGARSLNMHGMEAAKRILARRMTQFVIIAGDRDYRGVLAQSDEYKNDIRILPFVEEMEKIYSVADVAVSRAGASSVFELALFGTPTIFVPYPFAADDHQRKNVEALEASGAVEVIKDADLSAELLEERIVALLDDEARRREMSRKLEHWARGDAARQSAEIITALVKKNASCAVAAAVEGSPSPARAGRDMSAAG
ncbi:MAG: undecaprenyldiphospho-muramoylpentapeptide beta-N-acetylglucosaminyltransferase [Chitinivibrionia bacterium]|nr:undecaprenyldiphospho-muramoylpentapeptide beta-N-acetylglucosaminyltransferase [Chitinivibrionia bacterium]